MRTHLHNRVAALVLSSVTVFSSCGQRPTAATSSVNDASLIANSQALSAATLTDERSESYRLADSISRPGERIPIASWDEQVRAGVIIVDGATFGKVGTDPNTGEMSESLSPDFMGYIDPNGSQTIVGFVSREQLFASPASFPDAAKREISLVGSDGKTIVGVIVQTSKSESVDGITRGETSQKFVEAPR